MRPLQSKVLLVLFLLLCIFGKIYAQAPVISSFSPASGSIGSTVTINGSNFNATAGSNVVFFGGVKAAVTSASAASLKVTVPYGSTYQPISVINTANGLQCYSSSPFLATFNESYQKSFTAKSFGVNSMTGSSGGIIVFLQLVDIDGDGKLDLVMLNTFNQTIDIYHNTATSGSLSSASFTLGTTISVKNPSLAYTPYDIKFADLDGDGKLDLVVPYADQNAIAIFKNTSVAGTINSQSFAAEVDFITNSTPYAVAIADLDGDGKPEIITANNGASNVSVFRNVTTKGVINSSSFSAHQDFPTDGSPASIQAGDMDGDGKIDLVVGNTGGFTVLKNTTASAGSFSFTKSDAVISGGASYRAFIGDLDGDGKKDVVILSPLSKNATVYKNTTAGAGSAISFAAPLTLTTASPLASMAIADVNGDTKPDLVFAPYAGSYSIIPNNNTSAGTLAFGAEVVLPVNLEDLSAVVVGDVDGDGKPDIIGSDTYGNISLFHNNIVGLPTLSSFTPTSAAAGQTVTITGANLSGVTSVSFGGVSATSFTIVSSTTITAVVGNGASGSIAVTTADGTVSLAGFTCIQPTITSSGTLSALTTMQGVASPSTSFTISGAFMTAGILVSPPAGFEVSTDNSTFSSTVTVAGTGTITPTTVYLRLAAADMVGSYSGNIVLSSSGATSVNVPTISSTVTPSTLPAITTGTLNGNISACVGTSSAYPNILQFLVSGVNLTGNITATAPTGFEISLTYKSGYGNSVIINQSGGTVNSVNVFVRSAASAPAGAISGNVVLTSPGAATQNKAVQGTVNSLPAIKAVTNQTLANGASTTAVNFTGTGAGYSWINDTPSIGLAAAGTGNIASFVATNNGAAPVTATITATPLASGYAFVSDEDTYNVSVINVSTNALVGTLSSGQSPSGIALSPDGTRVYIANFADRTVSVFNTSTYAKITTISVSQGVNALTVGADGSRLYITSLGINSVVVINTATYSVITTIGVGVSPYGVSASGDGTKLYVANQGSNSVSVINTATNLVTATIPVGTGPVAVAVSPDGSRLYVSNQNSNNVSVINTVTNTVIATIAVNGGPFGICVNPNGNTVYTANLATNSVSVINTATNTISTTVPVGPAPNAISTSADGSMVYVACEIAGSTQIGTPDNLYVINTSTNTVSDKLSVNGRPYFIGNFVTPGDICPGTPVTFTITINPSTPVIIVTGTLSALSTSPGTASASTNFTVAGNYLASGILVTPPAGFEVSIDGVTYSSTVTVGGVGTLAPTTIYVRLSATAPVGVYSGNITLSGTNAVSVVIPTVSSVVSTSPTILSGTVTGSINACIGENSQSPFIEQFSVSARELTGNMMVTAPLGFEVSLSPGSGYGSALTINPSSGIVPNTTVYVCSSSTAPAGNITGSVSISSPGATTQSTLVQGVVSALPAVNPIASQTVANGTTIPASAFVGTANGYLWTNSLPAIGLAASGAGNTPAFTAVNNGSSPITATITVTPAPSNGFAYIAESSQNQIAVVNVSSNTIKSYIPVGDYPEAVLLSADYSTLYVGNNSGHSISVVNTSNNTVVATIPVSGQPMDMILSPDGSKLYVTLATGGLGTPGFLSIVNTVTNTEMQTVSVGESPQGIGINPAGTTVYVANYSSNSLSVVNTANGTITTNIGLGSGSSPSGVVVSPDGKTVYVTCNTLTYVAVISTATNTQTASIGAGDYPSGVAISADGKTLYVTSIGSNTVAVLDISSSPAKSIANVPVGTQPWGISLSPDGSFLYVINNEGNSVSVMNTATNKVTATIPFTNPGTNIGFGKFIAPGTGCTGTSSVSYQITVQPSPPAITATGDLSSLSTLSGMASSSTSFSVSGTSLSAGILVTPPAGFEVSTNNSTFSNTVTVGTGGAIASTTVYVRLAASTLPGSYSGNVVLSCTGAASVNVAVPQSLVTLSPTNFKLTITSTTCRGTNDGSVSITAAQALNYTATITGDGLNTPYTFTNSVNIGSLAAGSYNVCFTIAGQSAFSQCYNIVITEPQDLSVYSIVNTDNSLTLTLNGGNQYNIQLNGIMYTTSDNTITLPLTIGNNNLTVTTDRLCQGTYQKVINASGNITPYPVPFQNTLNLNLGNTNISNVSVIITDVSYAKQVYSKQLVNQSGVLQLDVSNLNNGVYVLHLLLNDTERIFKIIKK